MPTVDVVDLNNQKVGQLDLADEVFGAEVNESLLYEAVRQYQAGHRAGTHKTKVRSEVAGSGKKLWKQKGTGRARMGSVRSPLWRQTSGWAKYLSWNSTPMKYQSLNDVATDAATRAIT